MDKRGYSGGKSNVLRFLKKGKKLEEQRVYITHTIELVDIDHAVQTEEKARDIRLTALQPPIFRSRHQSQPGLPPPGRHKAAVSLCSLLALVQSSIYSIHLDSVLSNLVPPARCP
jgi:hypothetical protein